MTETEYIPEDPAADARKLVESVAEATRELADAVTRWAATSPRAGTDNLRHDLRQVLRMLLDVNNYLAWADEMQHAAAVADEVEALADEVNQKAPRTSQDLRDVADRARRRAIPTPPDPDTEE